MLQYSAQVFTL